MWRPYPPPLKYRIIAEDIAITRASDELCNRRFTASVLTFRSTFRVGYIFIVSFCPRSDTAVDDLYNDLYGDPAANGGKGPSALMDLLPGRRGGRKGGGGIPAKNLGVPQKTYLKVERLNDQYESYDFTLSSATESRAAAAARMRDRTFDRALGRATESWGVEVLSLAEKTDLLRAERELLGVGGRILQEVRELRKDLTDSVIKDEMKRMNVDIGELDPESGTYEAVKNGEGVIVDIDATEIKKEKAQNDTAIVNVDDKGEVKVGEVTKKGAKAQSGKSKSKGNIKSFLKSSNFSKDMKSLEVLNTDLLELELSFIRAIIEIMGPERANGIRAAIMGNINGGDSAAAGSLLKSLQRRPLSSVLGSLSHAAEGGQGHGRRSTFVMDFPGDVSASQVENLREEVTAVIRSAKPGDEALLILQSGGGTVTGYGLAAAQLCRLKDRGIELTIAVEQVAASGGYMMCCVADKIVASPFAVLGSIGVISDMPNVYERLKREGVEFQTVTAGKFKRTLTPTKKPTKEDLEKNKQDLEGILDLFKKFVHQNRPSLDIDSVATGETWFGDDALDKGLCDEIKTVDDVLMEFVDGGYDVYSVKYDPAPEFGAGLLPGLPFGRQQESVSPLKGAVQWLIKTVAPMVAQEVMEELRVGDTAKKFKSQESDENERYMMKDDVAEWIRMQKD